MFPLRTSPITAARALGLGILLVISLPLPAATLLKWNFETINPWTGMAGYGQTAGGTVTATPSYANVGTIDTAGTSTASSGLQLTVNSSAATGNWSARLDSGVLSLLTANSRSQGFLTLSFSLSASSAYPVRVKIESYNSANVRTGGLKSLIFPAASDFYQRHAIDLDKMTADGTGTFNPSDPKVRLFFELDSTANGTGWPVGAAHTLKVDNINYATPRYYVKPASIGGSNSNSGLDEANALSSVQAAINKNLSGDNIIAIMQDNISGGNDYAPDTYNGEMVSITKAGTPDAWIVCKNYPGHIPALKSNGWQAFKVHGAAAYVEIRGLIVRGQSLHDANGDRQINPAYASDIGKGRSSSSGNGIAANSPAHHVRVADNTMEYFGGANGGSADRLTFENNLIRYNCWWMVYAGSGISFAFASDWEQGANHRLLIRNNTVYGNECMIPWYGNGGTNYSDGNGIIIDSMTAGYTGKTLIQNNVVYNNGGGGIHVLKAENVDVSHNTTFQNSASGVLAYPDTDTQSVGSTDGNWIKNVRFANNIAFGRRNSTGSGALNETAMSVAGFDRATIFQNRNIYGGGDSTPLLTGANFSDNTDLGRSYNPASLFLSPSTDPAVADFRLRAAATARNYGTPVAYRSALDHDDLPRSLTGTTDTGAYQTVAGLAYSPIFSPAAGKYTTSQNITLTSDTAGATMVYTTNGTTPTVNALGSPTNGTLYTAPVPVAANNTLKAIAWKSGLATSPASTAIYDFQDLTAVPVSLELFTRAGVTTGGIFSGTTNVQPVTHAPGAFMRYTTNGTDPTETTGTAATYTGYNVTDYANLRYRAFKTGRAPSAVVSAEFTIRAKIGNTADGTAVTNIGANLMRFVRFQATDTFSAAYVFARIAGITGGYRAAIYSETSSAPASRLAESSLVANPATGWVAFPLAARVTLAKDSFYWLAIWSDSAAAGIYATGTGGTVRELTSTFSSTWPNPAGTSTAVAGTATYAIYAANQPPNLAPVVNAGPDQSVASGTTVNLAGTVTDDGVPLAPGTVTQAWSQVSGPGTVTFANPRSATTTATFSANGIYVLRLTGRDALLSATDEVTIGVGPGGSSLDPSPPAGVVRARFSDGVGTIWPQQYPGVSGDGWAGAWTVSGTPTISVTGTNPLNAGGNHLSAVRTAGTTALEGVYRQWSNTTRPTDQFSQLIFDVRLDSTTGVFNSASDNLTITARPIPGATSGVESTFFIRTFGAATGPLLPREWGVYSGDGISATYDANRFVPTGMTCVPGVTYTFTIDLFGATGAGTTGGKAHGTYDVTITDGTATVTVPGSRFRSTAYSSGGYLSFSTQQSAATDNLAFSVDSIGMTSLAATRTTLSTNATPADFGASVAFTATVASNAGIPGGTVTFRDGDTVLGTDTVNEFGVAILSTSALDPGPHAITAIYPANPGYTASISPALAQTIRAATTTTLTTSANPANLGSAVTFTVTVESDAGTPTGSVTFVDEATILGTVTLDASGTAILTTSSLSAGRHPITAGYSGNAASSASPSPELLLTIQRPDGTTRLLAFNAGGPAIAGSGFEADPLSGGTTTSTTNAINLSGVTYPAPEAFYQTERYGANITYTIDGLTPSAAYLVRLHFSENWWGLAGRGGVANTTGRRLFHGSINGTQRLASFDIWAAAGASNKAVIREFAAAANASGQLIINFAGAAGSPDPSALTDGLEIYTVSPFDAWRVANFTPAQLDNTGISSATADPDRDGSSNLMERALGSAPQQASSADLPTAGFDAFGSLTLTFFRASGDMTYIVEGSGNLTKWTPVLPVNPGAIGQSITVADDAPAEAAHRFLRLRVTLP